MSEPLLKAILRLFAVVAKEDDVTRQEREQIRMFLEEHLSRAAVEPYLFFFDEYLKSLMLKPGEHSAELKIIDTLCQEINSELTQKQKIVIILEVISIIQADGNISAREEELVNAIAAKFSVTQSEIEGIKTFVFARQPSALDHENILVIDSSETSSFSKAKHIYKSHLNGFVAILYIAQSELYFVTYRGGSDMFFNGVPVKSGRMSVLSVGSTLRWDKDEPVYYGDILGQFKKLRENTRTTFEAKGISFNFKNGKLGLRNVFLSEESGNLIALMGGSGAGKSTLLHVLNGSEKPSQGRVIINGIDIHKEPKRIEGVIGFVPQDDLLIEDLTVYQNLYFAAKLCFSGKTESEIDQLVVKVLEDLGLSETKDLKVGSSLQKTISGGQRKRLNIGLELLREPAVLFCDEPTSGLSSRDSENIIDLLKELALKGKLVFTVIHQPSSDIFKMFDKLIILDSGGYQIYYGNPIDSVVYFKRSINLINSDEGECHACGNVNPEQIFNIIETKVINEYGHFTNERKITAEQWNEIFKKNSKQGEVEASTEAPHSTLHIPTRLKQAHLFSLRDIQAKIHNVQYMIINLVEAPLLAFILAFIVRYYNEDDITLPGYEYAKNMNITAYLFMSVIVALFMGLTVSAEEIIRDRKILKREAFLHLSRSSYIFSKISILFMLSAIQTIMFVLVGSYILEIKGMFFEHWFILFTTSCFANLLGLNISSAFNSAVTIYILIPLLLIPQLILSGVVVKFDKLNPAIGNTATVPFVGDLMASRWAFEASMVTQFKDNAFEREFYIYDKVMADADFRKVYFIPELETRLQYCISNLTSTEPTIKARVTNDLTLIQTEIERQMQVVGKQKVSLDNFTLARFDSVAYNDATLFFEHLKKFYIKRFNSADHEKENKIHTMTDTPEKEKAFEKYRDQYHNEAIADLVKNISETHRIIEKDGKLIQKIFPIYKDPDPDHAIDFDAQFYMPSKHFLSRNIDTFIFNTGVIWSMTLLLALLLYFDILRKIIDGIGNLSNPLNKKLICIRMFFVLSKVLNFFTHPIVIVCLFLLLSVLVRRQSWKNGFFWIGFTLLFFFSNDFIANEVMHAWEIQPVSFSSLPKQYTYGIILTGVTMGKRVPDDRVYFGRGADRVVHTVQLYKLGHIKKILVSGGNGSLTEKEEKEADELKKVILIMGVKEEDILLENTSRNTHESAVEVKKILDKGINPDECILITSAFHMRRSRACFHKVGLDLNTFSTDIYTHERRFTPDSLVLPSEEALIVWGKLMKEWTGFVAYKVAGYV